MATKLLFSRYDLPVLHPYMFPVTDGMSSFQLYSTELALNVEVSANRLSLQYPQGTSRSYFSLIIGTFKDELTLGSIEDIPGVDISVSGNVDPAYRWAFVGQQNEDLGNGTLINDFEYWNCTFLMAPEFQGVPTLTLDLQIK